MQHLSFVYRDAQINFNKLWCLENKIVSAKFNGDRDFQILWKKKNYGDKELQHIFCVLGLQWIYYKFIEARKRISLLTMIDITARSVVTAVSCILKLKYLSRITSWGCIL